MDYAVLDIENVGEPWDGQLLCVGWRDRAYLPAELDGNLDGVLDELADPDIGKVVMTKHDHRWLRLAGYAVEGVVLDVQAMAWAVDENTDLDLATISHLYGGGEVKDPRITSRGGRPVFRCDDGKVVPLEDAPIEQVQLYNEQDLKSTLATFEGLLRRLRFEGEGLDKYWENEVLPLTPVLLAMETRGIPVDLPRSRALREQLEAEMAELDRGLRAEAGLPESFNFDSPKQLGLFLFSRTFELRRRLPITKGQRAWLVKHTTGRVVAKVESEPIELPPAFTIENVGTSYVTGKQRLAGRGFKVHKRTDSGEPSTDSKTLRIHFGDDPWVQSYLDLAKRATIVQTFLRKFEDVAYKGRVYGRFNQTGTATGRLSSSSPNLQNIPARGELGHAVRELFVPPPGCVFVHGDYGQLEPRVMAHLSQDPVLLDIFRNGEDVYLRTAQEIWNEPVEKSDPRRAICKTYVLALGYGAGPGKLRETLALDGFFLPLSEVEDTFEKLQRVYRVLFSWKEDVIRDTKLVGYVDTLSGHRRRIHFGQATSWRELKAGREGRQAANAKVQGSAADIVARTMVNLADEFEPRIRLLVQVHDELVMEARHGMVTPQDLARIQHIAEEGHGFDLTVPLVFEPRVVRSWAEGKD